MHPPARGSIDLNPYYDPASGDNPPFVEEGDVVEFTATVYPEGMTANISFTISQENEYAEIVEAPEGNKTEYIVGNASQATCHVRMLHGSSGGNYISFTAHDERFESLHTYACVIFDELPPI